MKQRIKRSIRITRYIVYKETLIDHKEQFWSFMGAFLGIMFIALIQDRMNFSITENVFLIGSFGATAVLLFGAIQSPLAQPRNLIGGHVLSAIIGVTVYKLFPDTIWLSAPLAVSFSIVIMQITKTLHPPGGATALIATMKTEKIEVLGYWYVLNPVLSGCVIMLVIALVFNNLTPNRKYPSTSRFTRVWSDKRRIRRKPKDEI